MKILETVIYQWKQFLNERLYRRLSIEEIPVKIFLYGESNPKEEKIGNWSPSGLFIKTNHVLPLETLVNLEFPLGTAGSVIQLKAQVVRHQTNPKTKEIEGMGVMFTDFSQSGLLLLRDLLLNSAKSE